MRKWLTTTMPNDIRAQTVARPLPRSLGKNLAPFSRLAS